VEKQEIEPEKEAKKPWIPIKYLDFDQLSS
jgi:hypothetical protein